MSEKRGYPNPNYTDEDIMKGIPLEEIAQICIDDKDYRELVAKATAFDILTASIKSTGEIKEDVVRAITGTDDPKMETEAQKYERWWSEETGKTYRLKEENRKLQEEIGELKKLLDKAAEGETSESEPCTEGEE